MPTNIDERLQKLGFDKEEITIYLHLLRHEGAYPSTIARETRITRPTVYRVLSTLAIRGWISETEKKKKLFYTAQPPKRLEQYLDLQINRKEDEKARLQKLLPDLQNLYTADSTKPRVITETGKDGVRATYFDHVTVNEPYEMLAWGNTPQLYSFFSKTDFRKYVKEKERQKVVTRGVVPRQSKEDDFLQKVYASVDKRYWPDLRYTKNERFPYKGEVTMYGKDKVSFINLEEDKLSATIIQDKTIHDMMTLAFEQAWKSLE